MINDGQCYFWIPSAFTVSVLTAEAAATINAVHTAIGLSPTNLQAGSANPYILRLNDFDMGGAYFTRDKEPGQSVCGPIYNFGYLSIQDIQLLVAFGGQVEGFPVWFELDDIDTPCPFSDDDETWETWGVFGESHKPVQHGAKWYRSSAVGASGELLYASVFLTAGVPILSLSQYQAVVSENSDGP
jgi:hypothetical protein